MIFNRIGGSFKGKLEGDPYRTENYDNISVKTITCNFLALENRSKPFRL